MGEVNQWVEQIIAKAEQMGRGVSALITGPLSLREITELVTILVAAAELVLTGPGLGADKKAAVKAVLAELEERYQYRKRVDSLIKLPVPLEWVDDLLLPILEGLAIDMVVAVLNVWHLWQPFYKAAVIPEPPPPGS